ncbi:tetratricopeptide repeat protein [Tumebacillus flagellatus]|nr:tetratricopeptide repeat protein [Tumebacillus flagellatus]
MTTSLGQKIRELRILKGLTQSDLGAGMVTPSMISQIEADKANPSHKLLCAIAEKLETSVDYFLTDMQTKLEQTSTYKLAKAFMESGEYDRAISLLEELLENPAPHLQLTNISFDLANCYLHVEQFERATELFESVLDGSIRTGEHNTAVLALNKLGVIQLRKENLLLAQFHWKKAYQILSRTENIDVSTKAFVITNLGMVNLKLGEYQEALKYYTESYQLLQGTNYLKLIGETYNGLGHANKELKNYKRAVEHTQDAIAIFKSLNYVKTSYDNKVNLAIIKGEEGKTEEALALLDECMEGYSKHGSEIDIANVHSEISRLLLKEGRYADAETHANQALQLMEPGMREIAFIYRTLAEIKLMTEDFDTAVEDAEKAIELFQTNDMIGQLTKTYALLGEIYKSRGDFLSATESLQKMQTIVESNLRDRIMVM